MQDMGIAASVKHVFDMTKAGLICVAATLLLCIVSPTGQAISEESLMPQEHIHHWSYEVQGDTITAHCDETCPITEGLILRIGPPTAQVYDGREKSIVFIGDYEPDIFGDISSVTYTDADNNPLASVPVDAGTYRGSIEFVSGAKVSVSYTVAKAPLMEPVILPTPLNSSYDGTEKPLVSAPAQLPDGCAGIQYGMGGVWSDAIPTGIDAGEYSIYLKFLGDSNHSDYSLNAPLIATIVPNPSGCVLATMTARGEDALNVMWTKAEYVDGYDVFLKKCQSTSRYQLVASVEGQDITETTVTGLSPNTNYKGGVCAWVMKDGNKEYVLDRSPVVHVITGGIRKGVVNSTSLKLNHANVTLKLGRRVRLNGTVKSSLKGRLLKHVARLRFLSSDPSVASVDKKGNVEALKGGSCVVYVLTNNGIWQSVNVTVDPSPENIWFDHPNKYLSVGQQMDLGAKLRLWPGKSETSLTWTSSDMSVATVSEKGVVQGLKKGKTTIVVTASNGERATKRIQVK